MFGQTVSGPALLIVTLWKLGNEAEGRRQHGLSGGHRFSSNLTAVLARSSSFSHI